MILPLLAALLLKAYLTSSPLRTAIFKGLDISFANDATSSIKDA